MTGFYYLGVVHMKLYNPNPLLMLLSVADVEAFNVQRTIFRADVVSSSCHVVLDVDGVSGGGGGI